MSESAKDIAIDITALNKQFRRFQTPGWRALDALGWPVSHTRYDTFQALSDITLTIHRGENVALIGRNGAGKSTLLRLIVGQLQTDSGHILVNGHVQALMTLGTGFHPEFTGIENIYSALAYQGVGSAQADQHLQDIIDFTELDSFLHRPVKEYSAGMYARLTFAVATCITPDILIVDEVLGAGDAYFLGKCIQRMKSLTEGGTTILFVSHDMASVQMLCERGIWLEAGRIQQDGPLLPVSKAYLASIREQEESRLRAKSIALTKSPSQDAQNIATSSNHARLVASLLTLNSHDRYGLGGLTITGFGIFDHQNISRHTLISGEPAFALIAFNAEQAVLEPVPVVAIYRPDGICAMQVVATLNNKSFERLEGTGTIRVDFSPLLLGPGDYLVSVAMFRDLDPASNVEPVAFDLHDRCYSLKVLPPAGIGVQIGIVNQPAHWELMS